MNSSLCGNQTVEHLRSLQLRILVKNLTLSEYALSLECLVLSGVVNVSDTLKNLSTGMEFDVLAIGSPMVVAKEAFAGDEIILLVDKSTRVNQGDLLSLPEELPQIANQFEVNLTWCGIEPLIPGRSYLMKLPHAQSAATVTALKYLSDPASLAQLAAKSINLGENAVVNLSTNQMIAFDKYEENEVLGCFELLDPISNSVVGCGGINFALRRSSNIHWQFLELSKQARSKHKGQQPKCIWFTGLSGSGKSTIANLLEKKLHSEGKHTYILDGDNVRHGLNKDLGFTESDRVENIRRVGEVAKLMVDAGLIVLVSFISPFRSERRMVKELFSEGEFIEVFVDTPIDECENRDVKGLYAKARRGELKNFTGIDSPYESPELADVHIKTTIMTPEESAEKIMKGLAL